MIFPEADHNKLCLSCVGLLCFLVSVLNFLRLAVVALRHGLHSLWHVEALVVRVHHGLSLETPADVILRVALGAELGILLFFWILRFFWIAPYSLIRF